MEYKLQNNFCLFCILNNTIINISGGTIPQWITPEVLNMFMFHELRPLSAVEELNIVQNLVRFGKLIWFKVIVLLFNVLF